MSQTKILISAGRRQAALAIMGFIGTFGSLFPERENKERACHPKRHKSDKNEPRRPPAGRLLLTLIDGLLVRVVLVVGLRVVRDDLVLGAGHEDGLFVGGCGWDDTILLGGGGGFPSSRAAELHVVYLTANGGFGRLGSSFGARGR